MASKERARFGDVFVLAMLRASQDEEDLLALRVLDS